MEPGSISTNNTNHRENDFINLLLETTDQRFWEYNKPTDTITYNIPLFKDSIDHLHRNIEVKLDKFIEQVHEQDRQRLILEISAFINSPGDSCYFTFQFKSHDGDWKWIASHAKKILYNNKHEAEVVIGVYSDITENKSVDFIKSQKSEEHTIAHEKLQSSSKQLKTLNEDIERRNKELENVYLKLKTNEEIFRQLVENTNDVFMLRDENNYIYINNQFEKIWGRDIIELIENPYKISEWIHPEDAVKLEIWVNFNHLISGMPLFEQFRIVKPDGTVRWLWTRTYPVYNEDNIPYRIVSISTDITDQKDFEDALLIAKEKALESDLLKSNFLANISHEIRTPMNGIVGFAELISRDDIDFQTKQNYVGIMKKSSQQLIRIIDDIIDFAKIEANQIRISPVKFNLNHVIDELAAIFNRELTNQGKSDVLLIVYKGLIDSEAEIIADDHRIRQVLSNIMDNAVKFTNAGEIQIGYNLVDEKIEFYIKDTGIGIPENKHNLIFERFRQADEGHTRKFGGTGLGLPISKGLINLLGGSIWLESKPNNGSNFYFTIPYNPQNKKPVTTDSDVHVTDRYIWKDKLFLIAEDDNMN
jgi:PAS domain S-box-containing protein